MAKALDVKYINFKDVHLPRTDTPTRSARRARKPRRPASRSWAAARSRCANDEAAVRKDFEYAKLAGMPVIVAAPSTDSLDVVEKLAKEFQIRVAIHNHGPEDKYFPSPYDVYKPSRDATSTWGCASTSATRGARAPIRRRRSSSCAIACTTCTSRISRDLKDRDSQVIVGKGAIDFPGALPRADQDRLPGSRRPRIRDRRRRSAARNAAVVRLHARRAGGYLTRRRATARTAGGTERRTGTSSTSDQEWDTRISASRAKRESALAAVVLAVAGGWRSRRRQRWPPGRAAASRRPGAPTRFPRVAPLPFPDAAQTVETTRAGRCVSCRCSRDSSRRGASRSCRTATC